MERLSENDGEQEQYERKDDQVQENFYPVSADYFTQVWHEGRMNLKFIHNHGHAGLMHSQKGSID